jgi:hypothetical protein
VDPRVLVARDLPIADHNTGPNVPDTRPRHPSLKRPRH